MRRLSSRQKLILIATVAVTLWLVAVVAVVLWRRPEFWVDANERYQRAEVLAGQRRWTESIAEIDRALAADPPNAGYLVFKGYRQLDVGDNAGAQQTFSRAITVDPSGVEARLGSATALARLGKRDEALGVLQTLSPDTISKSQLHRRSQLYSMLDAPQSALADLAALLHAEPGNPTFLKGAAELALQEHEWDRAASLTQRLDWATNDPNVKNWAAANRTIALEAAARDAEQHHQFRRAHAYALRAAGNVREAEEVFRELLASGAADVATREAYAWLLNTQHRYAEAWKVIEPLPRPAVDAELLELQARTAIWAGQTAESVHLIRALVGRRPYDAELWRRLSEAWDILKDDRQAADALTVYLRLQSQDWRARERLAQILSNLGSLGEAIAEYQQLLAAEPRNPEFLRSLGLVQETAGNLEAAKESYRRAIEASTSPVPELLLRMGRLHRWTSHPEAAVEWYQRYLDAVTDVSLRRTAEAELALSLFDAGDPAAAGARLSALDAPLDAGELVLAARAATATAQPAVAAKYLEMLSTVRPLTRAEDLWLAGQYRASREPSRALLIYERVAANPGGADSEVLEAIGDLRYDAGDFNAALRAFQQIPDVDRVALKVARSAARAGELTLASESYERYVRLRPNDLTAQLEVARYNASAGRPQAAIPHYRAFIAASGPADVRIELAREYLAAQQFEEAEQVARQAVVAGEDFDVARLTIAQSLHLQGRHREARGVLAQLMRSPSVPVATHEWSGYVAVALDRHLEAFRAFDRAIAAGATEPEKLLMLKGTAAFKRGDYARAADSYAAAAAAGAHTVVVEAARRELRVRTLPTLYVPVWGFGDSNDMRMVQTGGGLLLVLPSFSGDLALEGSGGRLSQRSFSSGVNSFRLSLSRLFPTPELKIDLAMGLHQFDRASDLVTWQGSGLYYLADGATIGLDVQREALLPLNARRELRQFNRVLDLQVIGPGFYGDMVRGLVEIPARDNQLARFEPGIEKFQDGNRRTFAYLHFEIPTANSPRNWTVIRPNMFFETFRDRQPGYFSPRRHLTLGTMWHTIRRYARWEVESEINPQLLLTDGAVGAGGHGVFNVAAKVGPASLGGGAFIFWDGLEDHLQWRLAGRVGVPLAR